MGRDSEAKLNRIRKISWMLRLLSVLYVLSCLRGLWLFATGPVFVHGPYWGIGTAWYTYNGVELKVYSLVTRERAITAFFAALYWGTAILCGVQLFRLLGLYARGEVFTRRSAGQVRKWGLACVAFGLVKLGYAFLPRFVANSRLAHGADAGVVTYGLIFVAISWFMDMAAEICEENELTV